MVEKLNLKGARIVGNSSATVQKVMLGGHHVTSLYGDIPGELTFTNMADAGTIELFIPLETSEWMTHAYLTDAKQMGKGGAMIIAGHFNVEEGGMSLPLASAYDNLFGEKLPPKFSQVLLRLVVCICCPNGNANYFKSVCHICQILLSLSTVIIL